MIVSKTANVMTDAIRILMVAPPFRCLFYTLHDIIVNMILYIILLIILVPVIITVLSAVALALLLRFFVKDFSWLDEDNEEVFNSIVNPKVNSIEY